MGYFRAVLKSEEVSKRAFDLTYDVLMENQGNYTAWYWRRKCIYELKLDLKEEMRFLNKSYLSMSKVYQYWQHKRVIAQALVHSKELNVDEEIKTLTLLYNDDCKNFHMWTYRMWLTEELGLWENEKNFMKIEIALNPTNNSLWNYRYFLNSKTMKFDGDYVKSEIQ